SVPGTWVETPLAAPLQLLAGQRYRIGVFYPAFNVTYSRDDLPNTFADGTIHQSYTSDGDTMPTVAVFSRWPLVDFRYEAPTPVIIPVTPAISGTFSGGQWLGQITITNAATNLFLRADDGAGRSGLSDPF